ncbi:MAG: hypothetical protein ABIZ07_09880 [Dermatophilaceae bacterium]
MKRRILALLPSRRTFVALASATALTAVASGCSMFSPVQTNVPYDPADGVSASVGPLDVRDLLLVGTGTGPAVISGSALNTGDQDLTVQFASEEGGATSGGAELQLAPREQVDLSTKGLTLNGITAKAGAVTNIMVNSSVGGQTVVGVPVLAPAGYYATITPAPTAN